MMDHGLDWDGDNGDGYGVIPSCVPPAVCLAADCLVHWIEASPPLRLTGSAELTMGGLERLRSVVPEMREKELRALMCSSGDRQHLRHKTEGEPFGDLPAATRPPANLGDA